MPHLYHGHAPGHIRDAFLEAVGEFLAWPDGEPEPSIVVDLDYVPHVLSLRRLCGLLWNCRDILPGSDADALIDGGLDMRRRTYGAAAQAMHRTITERSTSVAADAIALRNS